MKYSKSIIAGALALGITSAYAGQITLYERPDFQGRYVVAYEGIQAVGRQAWAPLRRRSSSPTALGKYVPTRISVAAARN